jgi:hypothetical protein
MPQRRVSGAETTDVLFLSKLRPSPAKDIPIVVIKKYGNI